MTIQVSVNDAERLPVSGALIEHAVRTVVGAEQVTAGEFTVTFLDEPSIRKMNREFLDHDWSTDVLSFSLHPEPGAPDGTVSGEVYIGADQARSQALELEISPDEEAVRLTVHGTLHLLGHDHPDQQRDESPFFAKQEQFVARIVSGWPR